MFYPRKAGPYGPDGFGELNDIDFTAVNNAPLGTLFAIQLNTLVGCRCPLFSMTVITPSAFDCNDVYNCLALLPGFGPGTFLFSDALTNIIWTSIIIPPPLTLHNNTIYVDAQYGNDGTGVREDITLPFQSINGAMGVALPGDLIHIRPGTYDEQIDFIDQVNYFLDKGAEITYTGNPGFDYIFRDNGVAVTVDISGEGRIYGTDKLLVYSFNAASNIKIQIDQLDALDTIGNQSFWCDGRLTLEANKVDFQTLTALPGTFRTAGIANIQCPFFNVYYLATTGTDATIVGDISAYQTAGGLVKMRVYGTTKLILHISTDPNSFITHIGDINCPGGVFGSGAVQGFGANLTIRGNVSGALLAANAISYGSTAYSKIDGVGAISGFQGISTSGAAISWRGDMFGFLRAFNYFGATNKFIVDIRGNLTSINPQATVEINDALFSVINIMGNITGLSTTNGSVFIGGNAIVKIRDSVITAGSHGVNLDFLYNGLTNLKKCKVYSGGVFGVPVLRNTLVDFTLEIDDSIFVSAPLAIPFSIQVAAAHTLRIYGSSMANNPYNPLITPVINAGPTGFIVDPVNVT